MDEIFNVIYRAKLVFQGGTRRWKSNSGALTRSYRSEAEGVSVELQLIPLSRQLAALINRTAKQ